MPGYISELDYYNTSDEEFIELALPTGTDASGYSVVLYNSDGTVASTFDLGTSTGTMSNHDVYVIDDTTPGFATAASMGNMEPGTGVALVDGDGNLVQFVSYMGATVTAQEGPAAGQTSEDIGSSSTAGSLQSDDGGQTYYAQDYSNSGTIPACYAPGTMILTDLGPKAVETLKAGDVVLSTQAAEKTVRWIWSGTQPLEDLEPHQKPVLIAKGALGPDIPIRDLIVSGNTVSLSAHLVSWNSSLAPLLWCMPKPWYPCPEFGLCKANATSRGTILSVTLTVLFTPMGPRQNQCT